MFEQCPKRLWLSIHRPHLAEQDDAAEARFATGNEVGDIARALLPKGVMIEAEPDLSEALAATQTLLDGGHDEPIFEATFQHDGVLVRVDVLEPDTEGRWLMAEVKSSTKPKDYHRGDLATQVWVARSAGVPIGRAVIRHLDTGFALEHEGVFHGLFADTELTTAIEPIVAQRSETIASIREMLAGAEPATQPGPQCNSPFACEFSVHCHKALPPEPEWPVLILPYGGGNRWAERGIDSLLELDLDALANGVHRRIVQATVSGIPFHDAGAAQTAMAAWAFPRTWLDFETIQFAVPRWIGTRPYQQVPFQFSAYIESVDGALAHREFLTLDGTDPRRACAEALVAAVPTEGAVIAYNASFERRVVQNLAQAFPDLADALTSIVARIVDLLPVTRACWYHRDQRGSWSIKAVLPTVAPDLAYSDLEVGDGGAAQAAYLEAMASETTAVRRATLDLALRAYCGRDTWAMLVLARKLCRP